MSAKNIDIGVSFVEADVDVVPILVVEKKESFGTETELLAGSYSSSKTRIRSRTEKPNVVNEE